MFVHQRHPDGVASVAFKEPEQADACIQSFNGRWFGGRQLSAQFWDGNTDYQVNIGKRQTSVTLWAAGGSLPSYLKECKHVDNNLKVVCDRFDFYYFHHFTPSATRFVCVQD